MGFNLGIALGSAAEKGVSSYARLMEENRQQQEFEWKKKEQDDQEAISKALAQNQAGLQTTGEGDMTKPELTSTNSQGQIVSDSDGMPLQTKNVSLQDAQNAAYKQMIASGVAVNKAQAAIMGGYQLSNAELDFTKKKQLSDISQERTKDFSSLAGFAHTNDVPAMLKEFGPRYKSATGNEATINSNGELEIRNSKGKLIHSQPGDAQSVEAAIAKSLTDHYDERLSAVDPEYRIKMGEMKAKESTAQTMKEHYGKGGTWQTVEEKKINAMAGKSKVALYNEQVEAVTQSLLDANPNKYKNKAEAKVEAAKMVLKAPAEIKGDANGNYVVGNKLYVPDPKNPGQFTEAKGFGPNSIVSAFANYDPNKAPDTSKKSAIPVQSQGAKQMDAAAASKGWKPVGAGGDMYFKLDAAGNPIHRSGEQLARELGLVY